MQDGWTQTLDETDWAFMKRFLLCSGSLKELARDYDVSYPTIRLRLDRLIQKIKLADTHPEASPFERALRAKYADGSLTRDCFQTLLSTYREEQAKEA